MIRQFQAPFIILLYLALNLDLAPSGLLVSVVEPAQAQTTHNLEIIFQRGTPDTSLRLWGNRIAGVGDVNGDGYDDVAIEADVPNTWNPKIYVFYGGPGGIDTLYDVLIEPAASNTYASIAGGDINKDGYSDIILGMEGTVPKVWIYYGGSSFDTIPDVRFSYGLKIVYCTVATGDLNGDDTTDLIIGDYYGNSNYDGHCYVFKGSAAFDTMPWLEIRGHDYEQFGSTVNAGGDVNQDGFYDLAVGAATYNIDSRGRIYIFHGAAMMDTLPEFWKDGEGHDQYWGEMPSAICPYKNGYARLWTGSHYYPGGYGSLPSNGKAELFYGGDVMDSIPDVSLIGEDPLTYLGMTFASALLDSNDIGDPVCGSTEPTAPGKTRCWVGAPIQDTIMDGWFVGRWPYDKLGVNVSAAGDVDNDGVEEIIMGSYADTNRLVVVSKYTGPNGVNLPITNEELQIANLFHNVPNPFKTTTNIKYQLSQTGHASVKIYNIAGQVVKTIIDCTLMPGYYSITWDGRDELGKPVSAGVYFYNLKTGDKSIAKKMLKLK